MLVAGPAEVGYFLAYLTTDYEVPGADWEVVFDRIEYNNGNFYDNTTGRFTTPVSGWYRIQASIQDDGASVMMVWVDNTRLTAKAPNYNHDVPNYRLINEVQYLTAGQAVYIQSELNNAVYGSPTIKTTWFSVSLVYAD